jgi:hypothetical protein
VRIGPGEADAGRAAADARRPWLRPRYLLRLGIAVLRRRM